MVSKELFDLDLICNRDIVLKEDLYILLDGQERLNTHQIGHRSQLFRILVDIIKNPDSANLIRNEHNVCIGFTFGALRQIVDNINGNQTYQGIGEEYSKILKAVINEREDCTQLNTPAVEPMPASAQSAY